MPGFDLKQIKRNDQGILGAGILFLAAVVLRPVLRRLLPRGGGFGVAPALPRGTAMASWRCC